MEVDDPWQRELLQGDPGLRHQRTWIWQSIMRGSVKLSYTWPEIGEEIDQPADSIVTGVVAELPLKVPG